jgi:chromosome segregation ATPase
MHRTLLLSLCFLFGPAGSLAQSASSDSQTLQALLSEVRQLRKDLQVITAAAQRAQILLYRLQAQEATVARASQRLDEARLKLAGAQSERKKLAANVKQSEDFVSHAENSPADRKQIEDVLLPQLKTKVESLEIEEQQKQTAEIEAEEQLRAERAKLSELQDQLDRLQKALEGFGQQPDGNPH